MKSVKEAMNEVDICTMEDVERNEDLYRFNTFFPNKRSGMMTFLLLFENVDILEASSPILAIIKDKKNVAISFPRVVVTKSGKNSVPAYKQIQFDISPEYVRESELILRLHPRSEKFVTIYVKLMSAKVIYEKDGNAATISMNELLMQVESDHSSVPAL